MGPTALVGPTEASKRAKAQKKLLEGQNRHLAMLGSATERQARSDFRTTIDALDEPEEWHVGDRVVSIVEICWLRQVVASPGEAGTVVELRGDAARVAWDGVVQLT